MEHALVECYGIQMIWTGMDRSTYLREDLWLGAYFELALEIGPAGDDRRAKRALEALWQHPALRGPWEREDAFGSDPIVPVLHPSSLLGCLRFDGVELGCMSWLIREESGSDWIDLSIPTGMLEAAFGASYPLDPQKDAWLVRLERLLATIGARIFEVEPFQLGLLGEEASGVSSAPDLTVEECELGGLLVPLQLWESRGSRRASELIAPGLVFVSLFGPHIASGG
ncbi:hypothetical protein SCE1572_12935 [Sorangium cellulosum So0157-2]|uniref:Uncharacterized protein n=2 Tax=Sorangium cellulosum TaxID=56 RepID=S4XSH6_SORCE|nr:hypothetical protein SCE1572_12935 [Sorangium cellulosum So0157-2]